MQIQVLGQGLAAADGLMPDDAQDVRDLIELWARKKPRNDLRDRYYLSHVPPKTLPTATVDTSDVSGYVDREVRYQAGKLVGGAPTEFVRQVALCASDQVARRGNATMRLNASRDGVRWARVPMGGETCTFCAMLASRGFVYRSARTAGQGDHWHRNCRCKVVPETAGSVEGYDPGEWYGRWQEMRAIDADPDMSGEAKLAAKRSLVGDGTVAQGVSVPTPTGNREPGMLNVRAHARTGGFSRDELSARQRDYESVRGYKPVILARSEYARVVSELNTNMSAEDRKRGVLRRNKVFVGLSLEAGLPTLRVVLDSNEGRPA